MTREEFLNQLPQLAKGYKPAPDITKHIHNVELLIVVGSSGVGKTSLMYKLGLKYITSDNTRFPRPEEKEGVDYFFRRDYDKIVQQIKAGRFVQVAVDSSGDLKATRDTSYPDSGLAVTPAVYDAVPIFRQLGFKKTTSVLVIPPSFDEWMRRLNSHKLSPEYQIRRLAGAARTLEFALHDPQMHFILNDDLQKAVTQTKNILAGKIDQQLEDKAKAIAQTLLANVEFNKVLVE